MTTRTFIVGETERLDRIAKQAYGTEKGGTVESLLSANPGLAAVATAIPAGTALLVPERVDTSATSAVRPWI